MIGVFVPLNTDKRRPVGYIVTESGCWEWVGVSRGRMGYGGVWDPRTRRAVYAHRYVYELAYGPIPAGLTLDHLCRNVRCVRPEHLEAVTHRENILRGNGLTAREAKQRFCKHGHTPSNTRVELRRGHLMRSCKTCAAVRERARSPRIRNRSGKAQLPRG